MKQTLLCVLALSLWGCAATASLEATHPLSIPLAGHPVAMLEVHGADPKYDETVRIVEAKLAAHLLQEKIFRSVVTDPEPTVTPSISIDVEVVDDHEVSGTERVLFGTFAGQGAVTLNVEITEPPGGEGICSLRVSGKSSGGTAFSGTTSQAIDQAVDKLVSYFHDHM